MSNFDPTGLISATTAGVRLVGAVLDVKGKIDNNKRAAEIHAYQRGPGESDVTGVSTSAPGPATAAQIQSLALQRVDPERETRAYETVNFVLRTIGSRILEANMVNMGALATALTAATSHIEVKLFSGETNRLFQSLARKLNDVNLVNSVFTSIYLVGFLTAELTSSLPNYKREYPALGPVMVQQMMRVAIGDDAFRENQTANLNAYQTVATTAGLLKPTDIGYSIFPEFPSFSPTKYSSKSILDRNSHKNVLEKLVKHFEQFGFPQPLQGRDVGPIRDWRFLASDSNSRAFEVDKADKQIGSQFGRVLYWLICSANRMPSGMAVVAYYDQHIALIRYLGPRFGYRVLNTGGDLNMSGPHLQLNKKLRATFDTWVVIMPSESLIAERHKLLQQTAQQAAQPQGFQPPVVAGPASQQPHMPGVGHGPQQPHTVPPPGVGVGLPQSQMFAPHGAGPAAGPAALPSYQQSGATPQSPGSGSGRLSIGSELSSQDNKPLNAGNVFALRPATNSHLDNQMESSGSSVALTQLNAYEHFYKMVFQERCNRFISDPPTDLDILKEEYSRLVNDIQVNTLSKIEAFDATTDEAARLKKKGLLEEVKGTIAKIDTVYREALAASSPPSRPSSVASGPSDRPPPSTNQAIFGMTSGPSELAGSSVSNITQLQTNPLAQELPANMESPAELGNTVANPSTAQIPSPVSVSPITMSTPTSPSPTPGLSSITSRPSVVRRKAPPPPKKVILAKALYDFEPEEEEEGGGELTFSEGDIIEIVEKSKQLEEDGWCRARVKGQKKIGLAPLDYLEELPNQPSGPPSRPSRVSSASTTTTIFEQIETQPNLNTSKPDTQVDIKVSSTNQKPSPTPNTASLTTQQTGKPNLDQKPPLTAMDSIDENNPSIAADQPPPSYSAAMSQSSMPAISAPIPQKLPGSLVSTEPFNPPVKPPSQPTSPAEQSIKPPAKPSQPSSQPIYHPQQPTYGSPIKPQQASGQYQSPNVQSFQPPSISMTPQNPYSRPQAYSGGPYAMPVMNPGMMQHGAGFGENLHAYAGLAEAASGFAQAGAHIFAATHERPSSYEPHHHESHNNETEHAGDQPNNIIHNTTNNFNQNTTLTSNDNSVNQATSTSNTNIDSNNSLSSNTNTNNNDTFNSNTDNNNNQSTTNSYSQSNQGPSYDGFDSTISTYYPPESSVPSASSPVNGYDYNIPYFPPETTAIPNLNLTSASPPQDPTYGTTTSIPESGVTPSSGPAADSNVYTTAPSTVPSQYVSDPSSNTGFSSSFLPASSPTSFDFSSSTSNQDISGTTGATNPLASLATPPIPDPSQYSASPDFSSGTSVSPFASLVTPGLSDSYTVTSTSSAQVDSSQAVSPFASLAMSDSSTNISSDNATFGATSPFASLAVNETATSGGGYFDASTTVTVTADVTSNATSPLAGLATSNTDVTSSTTTTTDIQYGYGNIYSDSANVDTTTMTTVDYSSNNAGNWNLADYTTTDSTSYDYSGSFDF